MRRRFFKPLMNFTDDFFLPTFFNMNKPFRVHSRAPRFDIPKEMLENKKHNADPEEVFNNFFNEN
jgi:hypothetical protein